MAPKWRIMVVDDEEDVRQILAVTLRGKYEVVQAHDGLDALEKIERYEPDFIIMDIMMPVMDGFKACEAIRNNPKFKNLSVLFLSALTSKDNIKKSYASGGDLFITKPVDPLRLLKNIDLFFEKTPPPIYRKKLTLEEIKEQEKNPPPVVPATVTPPTVEAAPAEAREKTAEIPPPETRKQEPAAPAKVEMPEQKAAPPPPAFAPIHPRLLVVDDDPDVYKIAELTLKDDFEMIQATDGVDAIEKILAYQPDLIVLDVMMPKMSGYQLCQSIRRNPNLKHIPIVFISAKASKKDQEYALRIGGEDFLAKP
ncbi:MAG: response regulator, partial [bacterium]